MSGMHHDALASMVVMGLLTSVVAPALVLLALLAPGGRRPGPVARDAVPARRAVIVLGGFAVLHAAVMLATAQADLPAPVHVALHGVLLAGAVVFWLPVLGPTRLPGFGRALYLFVASPCLDASALAVIVAGHQTEGLAMIVAMLPVAAAAVVETWRALLAEERGTPATGSAPVVAHPGGGRS